MRIRSLFNSSVAALALIGAVTVACSKKEVIYSPIHEFDGPKASVSVSLRNAVPLTKAELQTAQEKAISSLDVFVFRDGLLEAHGRSTSATVTGLEVTHGDKTIWAFVNYSVERMNAVTSLATATSFATQYAENGRSAFCMRGYDTFTVSSSATSFNMDVRRDVSKVEIAAEPQFTGLAAGGTLEGIYLINIPKVYSNSAVSTSSSDSWNFDNAVATAADPQVSALSSATGASSWQTALYGMPNTTAEAATVDTKDYVTKLVLKATVQGQSYWYPIGIPDMGANKLYSISNIAIRRIGADNPNDYISAEDIDITINVLDWETGEVDGSYNSSIVLGPMSFDIITDGTITWKCSNASVARTIQYRKNKGEWTDLTSTTEGASISVAAGDVLQFKGDNSAYATSKTIYNSFGGTAKFQVYGDLQSLMNYNRTLSENYCYARLFYQNSNVNVSPEKDFVLSATSLTSYCYQQMFHSCTDLTVAPELPATTLASSCYMAMFNGCSGLTTAPELPATTLAEQCYSGMFINCSGLISTSVLPATTLAEKCYYGMFQGCTSLATAPELPATTLAANCYQQMFTRCTSLTSAPVLPATTLAEGCYYQMFHTCTSLTTISNLPATILANNCYYGMFTGCTSLTNAPELSATTVASGCCVGMFQGCTNLISGPSILPATTLATVCYKQMFMGCTSLTAAPELPATTLAEECYAHLFNGCTSLTAAPELPATTLVATSYNSMFKGCSNLSYVKCLATNISASSCVDLWLDGVSATGTFVKAFEMNSWPSGASGIPTGWTVTDPIAQVANGHEYVDLGLRSGGNKILFATMNIGASSETDYGDYFAWGETSKHYTSISGSSVVGGTFGWASTPYSNADGTKFTKYTGSNNSQAVSGTADGLTALEPEDDAAYVLWGGSWRMPDASDISYLLGSSVSYEDVTNYNGSGINGLKITGKGDYSSSILFIPAAGVISSNNIGGLNVCGQYWCRDNNYALYYELDGMHDVNMSQRYMGMCIRPVLVVPE